MPEPETIRLLEIGDLIHRGYERNEPTLIVREINGDLAHVDVILDNGERKPFQVIFKRQVAKNGHLESLYPSSFNDSPGWLCVATPDSIAKANLENQTLQRRDDLGRILTRLSLLRKNLSLEECNAIIKLLDPFVDTSPCPYPYSFNPHRSCRHQN